MNNGLSLQKLKVLTYPLTSFYAYSNPDFLNSQNQDKIDYDIIFEEIRQGFYTTKLDSVKMLISKHWEIGESLLTEDILYKLNSQIGRKFLNVKDGKIYISSQSHDEDTMKEMVIGQSYTQKIEWNLLNHLLNMDSVIGAYFIENTFVSNSDMLLWDASIFTTNSLLDKMLEKGMADIHMHAGAARKFSHIWLLLMNSVDNDMMLNKIKIKTYNGYVIFSMYIKAVAVLRLLMAVFLDKEYDATFKQFVQSFFPLTEDVSDGEVLKICDLLHDGAELHGNDIINFNIKELFDRIVKASNITKKDVKIDNYKNEVLSMDILSFVFIRNFIYDEDLKEFIIKGVDTGFVLPEHVLVKGCIERLDKGDTYFNRLFWQYTRIKNIFYNYVVQQHTSGKGLEVFVPIYGRQGAIEDNKHATSEAFYSQMNNQNIVKLELRVSPKDTEEELKKSVSDIFKQYKNMLQNEYNPLKKDKIPFKSNMFPLLGIVFHFIKKIDTYKNKCYYLYSQEKDENYISYGKIMEIYKNQAKLIAKLRKEIPYISNYIVGIDAASKENNTEPYVLRQAYEILRNPQNIELTDDAGGYYIKTIGYTYHVGEDFRDVISGLRHVDEVIEEFKFTAGDRLGHAIVIGIDIEKWAEMNSTVYLPAGEYFENLLWEWGIYTKDDTYKDIENIRFLENRIFEVAEFIFGSVNGMSVRELYSNYKWKFKSEYLSEKHYDGDCLLKEFSGIKCILQAPAINEVLDDNKIPWTSEYIRHAMNCRYYLKNIEKTIEVNISRQLIEKYKKIQAFMKGKISEKGLVIEANPTSNLIIGDFATFEDYHIINLSSPEKEDVIITINTDDPVIFNTNLSNEFSLIFDIVHKKEKYSSKDIIQWLDKIRDNGVNYSFIPDRWLTRDEIINEIDNIIERLEIG